MRIKDLLSALPEYKPQNLASEQASLAEISQIVIDSRLAIKDCVFVALRGHQVDSHQFLAQVVMAEPSALVVEERSLIPDSFTGVVVVVQNSREALDRLASRYYGDPSQRLFVFGVTGTNGKTSCIYLFEHIFNFCGFATGVIGTIDHHLKEQVWPSDNSTPGPLQLQKRLHEMRELGAKAVAMEVTSHALDQHRADSVHFNSVLFTNLTRDHLDYHRSTENYFRAKQRLFTDLLWKSSKVPQFAVVNIDDPHGRRLRVAGFAGIWTYGTHARAAFKFAVQDGDFSRTVFSLRTPFGEFKATIPLCGVHNVYNAVGVIAAATGLGIPVAYSLKALASFPGVPGRLQPVPNAKGIHVLVDYAHTPDALENVLRGLHSVREQNKLTAQIITVFGCGGDRDRGKRPLMAAIAESLSDRVIVTSDNPRGEDPHSIIHDIMEGFERSKPFIEVDRKKAIEMAIGLAGPGDVVLIAGKGHEDYQQIGAQKFPFNDMKVASGVLI